MRGAADEGDIYRIQTDLQKPPHFFIVLNNPADRGTFLAVSFTDRHHLPSVADVWPYNYPLCQTCLLAKPSVIALRYAVIKDQAWLEDKGAVYVCQAAAATLQRARCNLIWFKSLLKPDVAAYVNWYGGSWTASPCGPAESAVSSAQRKLSSR